MLQLPSDQSYVLTHAQELGIVIKPVEYPKEIAKDERGTLQGKTKAEYLGWTSERIICAYYFHDGPQFIGVIAPSSLPPLNQRDLFQKVLGISRSQGKRYAVNGLCPEGMEPGTCSPFPSQSLVGKSIRDLLIYNSSELNQTPVDISIGGQGDLAQRTSVHIPYHGIHQILQKQFDDKVHLFS